MSEVLQLGKFLEAFKMASNYNNIPSKAKTSPTPFSVAVPEETLSEFKQLLHLSKLGPVTYENNRDDRKYGLTMEWMKAAKARWEDLDW